MAQMHHETHASNQIPYVAMGILAAQHLLKTKILEFPGKINQFDDVPSLKLTASLPLKNRPLNAPKREVMIVFQLHPFTWVNYSDC